MADSTIHDTQAFTCTECLQHLPSSCFYKRPGTPTGHRRQCTRCVISKTLAKRRRLKPPKPKPPEGTKFCPECKTYQHLNNFQKCKTRPQGRNAYCNPCSAKRLKQYRLKHKDRISAKRKTPEARARNKTFMHIYRTRASHKLTRIRNYLRATYGLTLTQYEQMFYDQDGRCAICQQFSLKTLCVDHDHATGAVRGLLCVNCNAALGKYGDSPERIDSAINYLIEHKRNTHG